MTLTPPGGLLEVIMKKLSLLAVSVWLLALPAVSLADDLAEIRRQIDALQQEYEVRIRALEERLNAAEKEATEARSQAQAAEQAAEVAVAAAPVEQEQVQHVQSCHLAYPAGQPEQLLTGPGRLCLAGVSAGRRGGSARRGSDAGRDRAGDVGLGRSVVLCSKYHRAAR